MSPQPATKQHRVEWQLRLGHALFLSGAIALTGCNICTCGDTALAQIIPDNTLLRENSTVTPMSPTFDIINGGARRGANLFHSFQEFNVGNGRTVYFNNPGIENILTRVTGGNRSNILGTLGVNGGNANLFLINPNGIIFGPNARLDVRGSFVASTASSIRNDHSYWVVPSASILVTWEGKQLSSCWMWMIRCGKLSTKAR